MQQSTGKKTAGKKPAPQETGLSGQPYRPGVSPELDAWFTAFFIENHLDHFTHPEHAAAPEQIRFMVYTEEDERYYPCSNRMFNAIMGRKKSEFITQKYRKVLQRVMDLIKAQIEDQKERKYLEALIRIKFEHEVRDQIMIPSRLEKRLIMIFLNLTLIEDPYLPDKALRNRRIHDALKSDAFLKAMNQVDKNRFNKASETLTGIRELAY